MSSQYGELRPTKGWDRLAILGHLSKFQRVSHLDFVTAPASLKRRSTKLCTMFLHFLDQEYLHFGGLVSPNRILPGAKFTLCQSCVLLQYWQHYWMALEQWASAEFCGVVQGRELGNFCSSFAPPICSRAAIALGIVPHSSLICITNW